MHQEEGENIYVSSILPHGAAACCGMIQKDDELLSVDDHIIKPDDELAEVFDFCSSYFSRHMRAFGIAQSCWPSGYLYALIDDFFPDPCVDTRT